MMPEILAGPDLEEPTTPVELCGLHSENDGRNIVLGRVLGQKMGRELRISQSRKTRKEATAVLWTEVTVA